MKKIEVGPTREIHVQLKEWKGHKFLDIRTYMKSERYSGYTKKGVTAPPEFGKEIAQAILDEIGEGE